MRSSPEPSCNRRCRTGMLRFPVLPRRYFDFFSVAFAVESDYFYREVFELAVGVERAVEYVHYVGHDFEVLEGFYCAPGRV